MAAQRVRAQAAMCAPHTAEGPSLSSPPTIVEHTELLLLRVQGGSKKLITMQALSVAG